jgi:lipopolysaccharide/colanic/teichoic acid biosynthesis glycosyltransferase
LPAKTERLQPTLPRQRRKFEIVLAAVALLLAAPLMLVVAIGVWLSDPGPVFYLADRAGVRGVIFRMYKFRTMRIASNPGSRISETRDPRVFAFGRLLRRLKLDELPQLLNIIRGEMAFVGPRPEDPWFVEHVYTKADRETLETPPGLTSPGTLYYFTHAEQFPNDTDTEASYISGPLKIKLALDLAYVSKASAAYDLRLVIETVWVLARVAAGWPALHLRRHVIADVGIGCNFSSPQPVQDAQRKAGVHDNEAEGGSGETRRRPAPQSKQTTPCRE